MRFSFFSRDPLRGLEKRRRALLRHGGLGSGALSALLKFPLPAADRDIRELPILILDFETSGLDADSDRIISMGWVEMQEGVIALRSARHLLIHSRDDAPSAAVTLHHIMPEMQRTGWAIDAAFEQLWLALGGKVLLVHGAVIERRFIQSYLAQRGLPEPPIIWLDTLRIARNTPQPGAPEYGASCRLSDLRRAYHLPDYPAHHALVDAIATGELLLAQRQRLFGSAASPLAAFIRASRAGR
ncbi:exonuclease domain-containing protein [Erwinia sp. HR93]|uniref:3'-5' exonuclease n=1 Tax=Erwinia sp. HR93 TaxID=3094840 RepID=UPI002ADEE7A0|nr:exonuclease domain-containing protein [Erwinia sp. HR93]MEA1064100.1 exonuclease domain-containing protein [Erwinia sp. HR93]